MDDKHRESCNMTYGLLNNKYSAINKPSLAYSICIYGQISLYILCKMLYESGCEIINVNTDGVAFIPDKDNKYLVVREKWEKQFSINLGEDTFDKWIQSDVNNYVAVTDKGWIVTKGGDTNKYLDYELGGVNYYFNNGSTRIIHKAVVDKLLNNKDIMETLYENLDKPILYQYILQAGGMYQGTFDREVRKYQKINRAFAIKENVTNHKVVELVKKRKDDGLVKFADAPSHMVVWNRDVSEFEDFSEVVDLDWYYRLAMKVYERWK